MSARVLGYISESEGVGGVALTREIELTYPNGGRARVKTRLALRNLDCVENLMREAAAFGAGFAHASCMWPALARVGNAGPLELKDHGGVIADPLPPWEPTEAHLRNRPLGYGFYLPGGEG
jgi:hypothetical protein